MNAPMLLPGIGKVTSVGGAHAKAYVAADASPMPGIGSLVAIDGVAGPVFALVSEIGVSARRGPDDPGVFLLDLDLVGEGNYRRDGSLVFRRGLSRYPIPAASVHPISRQMMAALLGGAEADQVRIGRLHTAHDTPAEIRLEAMLGRHFAVLGTTGSGKSCTTALLLHAMNDRLPNARILMIDPHGEYAAAFGDRAVVLDSRTLQLPHWVFTLDEMSALLINRSDADLEIQQDLLKDAIQAARDRYHTDTGGEFYGAGPGPTPYRLGAVKQHLEISAGRLDAGERAAAAIKLMRRITDLERDPRFRFLNPGLAVRDALPWLVSQILRLPADGQPMTIVDLSGMPNEVLEIVVAVISRLVFDFMIWTAPERRPPMLVVCEEAHRYVPEVGEGGFALSRAAIGRIAKEGRKYGLSLGLISQRPSEMSAGILSQCNTIVALRLSNDRDQRFVTTMLPEGSGGLISALPALGVQEGLIIGEGAIMPMRVVFDTLPPERRPRSYSADFVRAWTAPTPGHDLVTETVQRWRMG